MCKTYITSAKPVAVAVVEELKSAVTTARTGPIWSRSCRQRRKQRLWVSRAVGFLAFRLLSSAGHIFPGGKHTSCCSSPSKAIAGFEVIKGPSDTRACILSRKGWRIGTRDQEPVPTAGRQGCPGGFSESVDAANCGNAPSPNLRRGLCKINISYNYSQACSLSIHLHI